MKTNLLQPESNEILGALRSLNLNVCGDKTSVQENLRELFRKLSDTISGDEEISLQEEKVLFTLAPQEMFEAKLGEITGGDSQYKIAQFAESHSGEDSLMILKSIAPHLEQTGMEVKINEDDTMEIIIPERDRIKIDNRGKVLSSEHQEAIGVDGLHFISCFLRQDLAAVLKKEGKFRYALDISSFEKTPKDPTGRNLYLGKDIVDFHSKAPNFGAMLGVLFEKLIKAFETGKLDLLSVDLRGQNIYKRGDSSKVKRFERDRFIPIQDKNGEIVGIFGVADVFFQDEEETMTPFEGGEFHADIFTQADLLREACEKQVVKTLGLASPEMLLEECDDERKIAIIKEVLEDQDRHYEGTVRLARELNERKHGRKIDLYGISYISDDCGNNCAYCGHNQEITYPRTTLSEEEMRKDFKEVIKHAPEEFCVLKGENPNSFDDCISALEILGEVNKECGSPLHMVTFNIAPMTTENFRKLVESNKTGLPLQYRIFQETYDEGVYRNLHTRGPKANFMHRKNTQERALKAGFDEVGMGILLGINDAPNGHVQDIISLISHGLEIKAQHGKPPYSISIPRHQPVKGYNFQTPSPVDDKTYVFFHALIRLAFPDTKIIITSRENEGTIAKLEPIINIRDLAPRPGVGGNFRETHFQNELGDNRSAEEIIDDLRARLRR
jgi:thiazole biosynthesis protein ThiH